jgi:hypothetical protein
MESKDRIISPVNLRMKSIHTIHILLGLCLVGIAFVLFLPDREQEVRIITNPEVLSGISSNTCVATTTAWSIGPQEDKTVLEAKANRLSFALSVQDVDTTAYYLLGSDNVSQTLGHFLAASTTVFYDEQFPYRGEVKAMALASTTLMVTECLY